LLDNFYVESEISADGHEWTMGAYATDFVEKMWPVTYGHNHPKKYPYPAEGNFPIAFPAGGYLWDRAKEAGVSYRSYGEFVVLFPAPTEPATTKVKALQGHIDEGYRGFDLNYYDTKRAQRFISELKRFENEGDMPRLQIIRLPNDHTFGVARGKRTPIAYVADNDVSLGQIVEAVSHSKSGRKPPFSWWKMMRRMGPTMWMRIARSRSLSVLTAKGLLSIPRCIRLAACCGQLN